MLDNRMQRVLKIYDEFNTKVSTYDRIDNSDIFLLFVYYALRYEQKIYHYFKANRSDKEDYNLKLIEAKLVGTESPDYELIHLRNFKEHRSPSTFINAVKKMMNNSTEMLETREINISKLVKFGDWAKEKQGYQAIFDLKEALFQVLLHKKKYSAEALFFNDLIIELSGKSNKEQFSTHKEITEIVAYIVKQERAMSLYDPACGAGSLLIEAGKNSHHTIKLYGQDNDEKIILWAELNSILAEVKANFAVQDSFYKDNKHHEKVDMVISEPPLFSKELAKYDIQMIREELENYGEPGNQSISRDEIFILNMSRRLKQTGLMILILPHSILYKEGEAEYYRQQIISEYNSLDAIILPSVKNGKRVLNNYVILIYRQNRNIHDSLSGTLKNIKTDVMMISDMAGNELTAESIASIYLQKQELPGISRIVSQKEIRDNHYNFNLSLYLHEGSKDNKSHDELIAEIHKVESQLKKVQIQLENELKKLSLPS